MASSMRRRRSEIEIELSTAVRTTVRPESVRTNTGKEEQTVPTSSFSSSFSSFSSFPFPSLSTFPKPQTAPGSICSQSTGGVTHVQPWCRLRPEGKVTPPPLAAAACCHNSTNAKAQPSNQKASSNVKMYCIAPAECSCCMWGSDFPQGRKTALWRSTCPCESIVIPKEVL